jgi:hypothetical protein
MAISADDLMWIDHLLFMVSRTQPKINLQKLIVKNGDAETKRTVVHSERFSVLGNTPNFKTAERGSIVFIRQVIELVWLNVYFFLLFFWRVFLFITIIISLYFRVCPLVFFLPSLLLFVYYLLFGVSGDGIIICKLEFCN